MSALDAALGLARRGMTVMPLWWTKDTGQCACGAKPGNCKPGKHPLGLLVRHGLKDATLDPRTIGLWWRKPKANVGIATGGAMRLLVVDIDPDADGETSISALERDHGSLPSSVEVITPRAGRHVYLLVPDGRPLPSNSAGKLAPGIDTRCQGGLVVVPPSRIGMRPYAWSVDSGDRIAMAPDWLLDLLEKEGGNGRATPPEEWLALVTAGVDEGARNQTIARVAGLLFRRLVRCQPEEVALAAELVACFNAIKCRPPLGTEELQRTLDSIAAKEMRRRGMQP
jgi:Bifunctional DNA primase/polymerase, N-terminal/Primase C terminal 1 (PriCT-1)